MEKLSKEQFVSKFKNDREKQARKKAKDLEDYTFERTQRCRKESPFRKSRKREF